MTTSPPPASIALANGVERWTLYGFAPGDYYCQCFICDQVFVGDKRATTCLTCAAKAASAALASPPAARQRSGVAGLVERWRNEASKYRSWSTGGRAAERQLYGKLAEAYTSCATELAALDQEARDGE